MILCKCGCGQEIIIKSWYKYDGIPKYLRGHHKIQNSITFPPIFDLCHCGCNEIVYNNKKWKRGHSTRINNPSKTISSQIKHKNTINTPEAKLKRGLISKEVWNRPEVKIKMMGENNPSKRPEIKVKKLRENNGNWKGGVSFLPYCEKFDKRKREDIRKKYDYKCYSCGKRQTENLTKFKKVRKLSVHHIDFDKQQGCDGKGWKLIPLCLECHGKIHWDKISLIYLME